MPKNIVICCDGTGKDFSEQNSNVVKLVSVLDKNAATQVVYYDPGVGTPSSYSSFDPLTKRVKRLFGNMFGYGISQNIMDAYSFLMTHYEEGDRVYFFGFSRGAYTVRAIAGLVYKCGLLHPNNINLVPEAMRIFKLRDGNSLLGRLFQWLLFWQKDKQSVWKLAKRFEATFCRKPFNIRFLGVWDTVSSVGFIYNPVTFDNTTTNPSIDTVRHAVSMDERRAFFRQNLFQAHKSNLEQDIKQVWFAGVHSDVGGGYAEARSGLSNIALEWMLVEAMEHELCIANMDKARSYAQKIENNHLADQNQELWAWLPGEIWPKVVQYPSDWFVWPLNNWLKPLKFIPLPRLNLGRRRYLRDGLTLHESLLKRLEERPDYRPGNLVRRDGTFRLNWQKESWRRL